MSTAATGDQPSPHARSRRPRRRWWWIAAIAAIPVLIIGAWVIWSLVRPNPKGFAPTARASDANPTTALPTTAAASSTVPDSPESATPTPRILQFTIDARSRQHWVFFNFVGGAVVETTRDTLDWDLAFRRNDILTNGGETNPAGKGGAIDLGEVSFDEAVVPTDGFATDAEDDERGLENPDLHKWYSYNWTTHVVSSRNHTYAIRSAAGDTFLFTFVSYYCDDRSPACVTFRYQAVDGQ